jgi:hypothetical protein
MLFDALERQSSVKTDLPSLSTLLLFIGPMVYACAFAPLSFLPTLQNLGFDDSKALSHATRDHLFSLFQNPSSPPSKPRSDSTSPDDDDDAQEPTGYHQLHYSTRVLSPADISRDMLRGVSPVNLNKQAEDATVLLIGEVQRMGIDIAEVRRNPLSFCCRITRRNENENLNVTIISLHLLQCYVDALGACGPYQAKLSSLFPFVPSLLVHAFSSPLSPSLISAVDTDFRRTLPFYRTITFDVRPKADSLFKIVGAASIAAKITRDRYLTHWIHPESALNPPSTSSSSSALPPSLTPTSSTSLAVPTPLSSTSAATTSFTSSTTSSSEALIDPDGTIIQDGQNDETAAPPPAKKRKVAAKGKGKAVAAGKGKGKGKEKKKKLVKVEEEGDEGEAGSGEEDEDVEELEEAEVVKNGLGSGYPSGTLPSPSLSLSLSPSLLGL